MMFNTFKDMCDEYNNRSFKSKVSDSVQGFVDDVTGVVEDTYNTIESNVNSVYQYVKSI